MRSPRADSKKTRCSPPVSKDKKALARWNDGLFYMVNITKVWEGSKKCAVEFEDKSLATVFWKDLLQEKDNEEPCCHGCRKSGKDSDDLVICSNCERAYHRLCHVPAVTDSEAMENFNCRICVFASCAQIGGALTSGPMGSAFKVMKRSLPYELNSLAWDAFHLTNLEQSYCYCGGPGDWYNKMLQCCQCHQWFHEACINCLEEELMIGDRYHIFVCSHCNGDEAVQRLELTWLEIIHITLFHLTMTHGTKYVDLDTDIIPFLLEHSKNFGLKKLLNGLHGNVGAIRKELIKILRTNDQFCCGSEVKKKCSWYGLRHRIPPTPPPFFVPDGCCNSPHSSEKNSSKKKTLFTPCHYDCTVPYVLRGASKVVPPTLGAKLQENKKAKLARMKSEHNYCSTLSDVDSEHCHEPTAILSPPASSVSEVFDANNNSPSKHEPEHIFGSVKEPVDISSGSSPVTTDSKAKNFWTLDLAIPEPPNFQGANHPFLTDFEQKDLRCQRDHFIKQLQHFSSLYSNRELNHAKDMREFAASLHTSSPATQNVKGFKGELADLINSSCGSSSNTNVNTPCKVKSYPSKQNSTPENLLVQLSPSKNRVSPRNRRSLSGGGQENVVWGDELSQQYVNGGNNTPNRKTSMNSSESKLGPINLDGDHFGSKEKKRLRALNRCLKNLTPTCGFHFPVLEENHPAVIHDNTFDHGSMRNSAPVTSSSSSSSSPSFNIPCSSSSLSNSSGSSSLSSIAGKRGQKRKHQRSNERSVKRKQHRESEVVGVADTLRRSHRCRSAIQRFEATLGTHNVNSYTTPTHLNSASQGGKYDVVSLRVSADRGVIEYLVNWSQ